MKNIKITIINGYKVYALDKKIYTPWQVQVDKIGNSFAEEYDIVEWSNPPIAELARIDTNFFLNYVEQLEKNNPIKIGLDLGTGTGRFAFKLLNKDWQITALDSSLKYLKMVTKIAHEKQILPTSNKLFLVKSPLHVYNYDQDLQRISKQKGFTVKGYTLISAMFGVFNHVEKWQDSIKQIAKYLISGGKLITSLYGTSNARVHRMVSDGTLIYNPALVQKRSLGGICLNGSNKLLLTKFPSVSEFVSVLESTGLIVEKIMGFLDLAACYPKETTPKNMELYKQLIQKENKNLYAKLNIKISDTPKKLLRKIVDLETNSITSEDYTKYTSNELDKLYKNFAYIGFVARKP